MSYYIYIYERLHTSLASFCKDGTIVDIPRYSLLYRGEAGASQRMFSADWYEAQLNLERMDYLLLDADDHPQYPILCHFEECHEFLRRCRTAGRKVLIHCVAGQNRSATLCTAFLMQEALDATGPLSLDAAVHLISSRRPGGSVVIWAARPVEMNHQNIL